MPENTLFCRYTQEEATSLFDPANPIWGDCAEAGAPMTGITWRLNLCRIAEREPNREYLSWRPTFTPQPDFHKPESFGHLLFLDH